jgi:predicted nucleotidyltransferase
MPDTGSTPATATELPNTDVLRNCREASRKKREELEQLLSASIPKYTSEDTSLVVFGSLAREEWTSGSDLDWTYLIDGEANSDHLRIAQEIRRLLEREKEKFKPPGQTETFGNLAFSHDLIHQIGGQNDTNKNTTRRILLLLESVPIGKRAEAHERVVRGVINRYLEEDNHPLTADGKRYRVPRFLLNDIVRFWRTMAVDFASKQRDRGGSGWGIRNAKLRMSRKLIFASGLLVCFSANLDPELQSKISTVNNDIKLQLVEYIRDYLRLTPLDILARSIEKYDVPQSIGDELFDSYKGFLKIIDNEADRQALEALRAADSRTDRTFESVRKVSEAFDHALDHIFFENVHVAPLTRKYGFF